MAKLTKMYTARVRFDQDATPVAIEIAREFFIGRSTKPVQRMVVNTIPLLDSGDISRVLREFLPVAYGRSIHGDVYVSAFVEVTLPVYGLTEVLACCALARQECAQYFARFPGSLWVDCRRQPQMYCSHLHHLAEVLPEFMGH